MRRIVIALAAAALIVATLSTGVLGADRLCVSSGGCLLGGRQGPLAGVPSQQSADRIAVTYSAGHTASIVGQDLNLTRRPVVDLDVTDLISPSLPPARHRMDRFGHMILV